MSRSLDRPPFDLFIAALDERQKGVDDLPRGKTAYFHKGLVQIALIQEVEKLLLETATAVLQLKGPCAQDRNREKHLEGKISREESQGSEKEINLPFRTGPFQLRTRDIPSPRATSQKGFLLSRHCPDHPLQDRTRNRTRNTHI
jgi:hypothetical protein